MCHKARNNEFRDVRKRKERQRISHFQSNRTQQWNNKKEIRAELEPLVEKLKKISEISSLICNCKLDRVFVALF